MTNLSIKDVPEELAEALRLRAARNHRSLQGELMAIIEAAVQQTPEQRVGAGISRLGAAGTRSTRRGWKTTEQIIAEHRMRCPEPIADQPLGVDIIREDRDSR